jgi:hypothetical protein
MGAVSLQDQVARVGAGPARRKQQVRAHLRRAARLERQEAAQLRVVLVEPAQPLQHRPARHAQDPAGHHAPHLALGMSLDERHRPAPAHRRTPVMFRTN